jgi:hypothetical protein
MRRKARSRPAERAETPGGRSLETRYPCRNYVLNYVPDLIFTFRGRVPNRKYRTTSYSGSLRIDPEDRKHVSALQYREPEELVVAREALEQWNKAAGSSTSVHGGRSRGTVESETGGLRG